MAKKTMSSTDETRGGAMRAAPAQDRESSRKVVKKVSGMTGEENQDEADEVMAAIPLLAGKSNAWHKAAKGKKPKGKR